MFIRSVVSVAALVGLAACGGSGASSLGRDFDLADFPNATYAELDRAVVYLNGYKNSKDAIETPDSPVTYFGVILMGNDLDATVLDNDAPGVSDVGVIGQVKLDASFENGFSITGEATNFWKTGLNAEGNPDGDNQGELEGKILLKASVLSGNFFELSANGLIESDVDSLVFDSVEGTFDDNAPYDNPLGPGQLSPGFKTLDASGLWVRSSDDSQLEVNGTPTWDGVIAAER